ncbi:Polyketide cyclase / dehydrase and lipid transport [Jatrophihabitans endophyticus]|uniref:Polyketide cyclase / dehydrase and lipid transport n=1 Tax=Jatrophihabitans endophyticus TaxID=1206085 RepID=A0A1M5UHN1_9ACTN|nr:SRPBCC family protein [Jatrophihabitans endophyticus]SHH62418.1 Polyketide cyclase / dehydrase and lipid transport [Jatrophihabitans endophyticus]
MTVHLVIEQELPAPCEQVFDTIHDYRHRLEWDTLLRRAYTVDDAPPARGVTAVCTAAWWLGGYSFRTRYVTFDRPTVAAIKLESRPPFFAAWAASIRHTSLPGGRSRATYTMTFTVRPARLAPLLEPVAKALFRRETQRRLRALARHLARSS